MSVIRCFSRVFLSSFARSVILALVFTVPSITLASGCQCTWEKLIDATQNSTTIVDGMIKRAYIDPETPKSIGLLIKVEQTIKGEPKNELSLRTPAPPRCGVNISVQRRMTWLVSDNGKVSPCLDRSNWTEAEKVDVRALQRAIIVAEVAKNPSRDSLDYAKTTLSHARQEDLEAFYAFLFQLTGQVIEKSDAHVKFGQLTINFKNGKFNDLFLSN